MWERRTSEYCEDIEAIMIQLGIPLERPQPHRAGEEPEVSWTDSAADYLRHRAEHLNSALTRLAKIATNRQAVRQQQLAVQAFQEQRRSTREAKRTKAVTLLGLLFIPIAYTSSLFSMSEPFRPGDPQFWIYFVASAPLVVLVILGYYILDWGYTDDG